MLVGNRLQRLTSLTSKLNLCQNLIENVEEKESRCLWQRSLNFHTRKTLIGQILVFLIPINHSSLMPNRRGRVATRQV